MANELVIVKPSAIAKFETKKKRYEALLSYPEVTAVLNEMDGVIVAASIKETVAELSDEDLLNNVGTLVEFVCRDLGITQINNKAEMEYSATRFMGMIKRHYKDLTVSDIKLAFELLEVGNLDPYLPKNRQGNPDREHYQLFNVKFYTKVLSAYRKLKSGVWGKAQKAYGVLENKTLYLPSKQGREYYHNETIKDIYKAFHNYKENGTPPNFALSLFVKEFVSAGLFELPKPTKAQIKEAYQKTISDTRLERPQRNAIIEQFKIGNVSHEVKTTAQMIAYNLVIKDYFDAIIKSKTDIKEVIK